MPNVICSVAEMEKEMMNLSETYDVVVVGAGPSGIAAAISASENGAKTLLVEKYGYVGGMSTGGFLNLWCGDASSGILSRIKEKTVIQRGSRRVFNPEEMKNVYIEELENKKVDILLHAPLCEVVVVNGNIKSIVVLGKNGREKVSGKIFIDSTGDGDLAYLSGVSYKKGRESDGLMQPMSLMFMVGGVDEQKAVYPTFGTHPHLEELMQKEIDEGRITPPAGHVILVEGYHKGTASVNMTNIIKVDGTEILDLTKAELHTRKQILPIIDFLRRCVPGYENCYLLSTANYIGVRETRHFEGEFKINENHILQNVVFEDWIVSRAHFVFGNHSLTGSGSDVNNLKYNGKRYTIPYGCFIAKGIENLYLNGRCISGTHMAHSSYRVMPICVAMGQGVGTAAAVSIRKNVPIRLVNVNEVQKLLLIQGVEIPI